MSQQLVRPHQQSPGKEAEMESSGRGVLSEQTGRLCTGGPALPSLERLHLPLLEPCRQLPVCVQRTAPPHQAHALAKGGKILQPAPVPSGVLVGLSNV